MTCSSDKDPRLRVRSNFLGGSSLGYVSEARSMKLQASNRFEVLVADVNMDSSQHEVTLEEDPAKNQEETETWCTKVTEKRSSRFRDTQTHRPCTSWMGIVRAASSLLVPLAQLVPQLQASICIGRAPLIADD